jgi:hypothetical protein
VVHQSEIIRDGRRELTPDLLAVDALAPQRIDDRFGLVVALGILGGLERAARGRNAGGRAVLIRRGRRRDRNRESNKKQTQGRRSSHRLA